MLCIRFALLCSFLKSYLNLFVEKSQDFWKTNAATLFPDLPPKLNMGVGSSSKSSNPSLNSFSNSSLVQLHEVIRKKAFYFQHPGERFHILLPLLNCIVRIKAYGIKSPFVNTNLKSRELCGKIQKSSTFNLMLDNPSFSRILSES